MFVVLEGPRNPIASSPPTTQRRRGRSSVFCFPNTLLFAMLPAVAAASPALYFLPAIEGDSAAIIAAYIFNFVSNTLLP